MREQVEAIRCDFCQYGRPWNRPERLTTVGGVDLCRWCADGGPKAWTESGGHKVTFNVEADGWSCSCGFDSTRWPVQSVRILTLPRVLAALPSFDNATAHLHIEGRLVAQA